MPTRAPLNSRLSPAPGPAQPRGAPSGDVRELLSLAARGLVAMFDADKQLFCHRLLRAEQGIVREGLSRIGEPRGRQRAQVDAGEPL